MRIYIGFDDADNLTADRGTGKLARWFEKLFNATNHRPDGILSLSGRFVVVEGILPRKAESSEQAIRSVGTLDFRFMSGYLIIMRFRALTIIVLVIAITTFTGLPGSVSAALQDKAEGPCCDACNQAKEKSPDQCSTPDCPVFLCVTVNLGSSFALPVPFGHVYIHQVPREPILKLFSKLIYHPPKIA